MDKRQKKRVLFIKPGDHSFVRKDEQMLKQYYDVTPILIKDKKPWLMLADQIVFFFRLLLILPRTDAIFIWFADLRSFLPTLLGPLFGVKSILVLGGYDVNCLPEYDYGVCRNPVRRRAAAFSIRNATYVLPVAHALKDKLIERGLVRKMKGNIFPVGTAFDPAYWYAGKKKEDKVIMVATTDKMKRVKIKGVDRFLEVATMLPEIDFVLVGLKDAVRDELEIPSNVRVISFAEDLRLIMAECKVYLLLSRSEGLPSVIAEAMLCECVVVTNDIGDAARMVGNTGYALRDYDSDAASELVRRALTAYSRDKGKACRDRIIEQYGFDRRSHYIRSLIDTEKKLEALPGYEAG